MRRLIELSIHGKLYFVLVIFDGIILSIAASTSDLKLTHMSSSICSTRSPNTDISDLVILGAAIFDCVIGTCDLHDWFMRTCFGPTVIPAVVYGQLVL